MDFPLQVQFRGMDQSDFVYNDIWDHAEKISKFYDRIISCHVVVDLPHRHHRNGKKYHVEVRLHIPQGDIIVNSDPEKDNSHEDVYVAIRDAFAATRRRLEDHIRRKRENVVMSEREAPA